MTEKLSPSKFYRSLLVFFSDELLEDIVVANQLNPPEGQLGSPAVAFKYDSFITHFVASLMKMTSFTGAVRTNLLRAKMTELLVYLHATQKETLHCFIRSRKANHDLKMIHVVESNSLNKLSLSELAFLSNMSVSTFKRSFEKHFGTSPIKWFQQKRLEHAAYLLGIKGQRASDVYLDAGYENLSNFIQAFKIKYGITPKQYQEKG
ncbi:MAG: AraC family transcriptional regulator [Flavobacteriales bacterium]|nr:AraC family transcriptional regulator [Flavobacteriales bacterium]